LGGGNPWLVAIAVMLATFMEVLDTSIAAVALPYIAGSLSATNEDVYKRQVWSSSPWKICMRATGWNWIKCNNSSPTQARGRGRETVPGSVLGA